MIGLMFLGVLLAIYLSLALLPAGRTAALGIAIAAGVTLLSLQITTFAAIAPLAGYAVGLAALAQGLRYVMGARLPDRLYRALLGLPPFLLVLGVLLTTTLGPQ
jgi:hypothetical protein